MLVTGGHYVSSARGDANPHSILIYNPPGTTHRDHFFGGKGAFFSISISSSRLAGSLESAARTVAANLADNRSCGLATALLMECARWNASSPLKAESLCLELLSSVSNAPPPLAKSPPRWLRMACELIQDCPGENPGIRSLADTLGVHPTSLARTFRTFLGCTPGDLLRARRLERAGEALINSTEALADIALDSGFSDQAQFSKAFRRLYGVPPGLYRRLGRRGDAAF